MHGFFDVVRRHAGQMDAQAGQPRFGIVSSYDPNAGAAQVLLQPEGALSGWLPVLTQSVGAGWGLHVPLSPGDQVLVLPHEGDASHGIVVGRVYSDRARPPSVAGADAVLRSSAGAQITLLTNGHVTIADASGAVLAFQNDGTVTLTGSLVVSGDIIDAGGAHGSLANLRTDYNAHQHSGVQTGSGSTSTTSNPTS